MPNLTRGTAQCSYDKGSTYGAIKPEYDTAIANAPFSDCVLSVGDKFELGYTSSSLLVSLAQGNIAKVGGAFWVLKDDCSIELEANQEQYICLTIDNSQQDGSKADITIKTQAQIQKGILYAGDNIRDYAIYKVSTNENGVSTVNDLRKIVKETYLMPSSEYEALTKDNETLYYVEEQ